MSRSSVCLVGAATALTLWAVGAFPVRVSASSVPVAACQSGDSGENSPGQLDGQVPQADRLDGRAVSGYRCNLKLVGNYSDFPVPVDPSHPQTSAWATLDTYANCAYYGQAAATGWTTVLDLSDPAHPVETAHLDTAAMVNPWESMRVNQRRGLLVADRNGEASLDIYDLTQDCRHPRLLRSLPMPTATGHEGWFEPDGMVYYMSCLCTGGVWAIDLTNPQEPTELAHFTDVGTIHGGSESADGTRAYLCATGSLGSSGADALLVVDTSDVAHRRPHPTDRIISSLPWPGNSACQSTYPLMYGSHPYVVQYGESSSNDARHCQPGFASTFSAPRIIDVADERNPKVTSNLLMQVDDPANCPLVQGDASPRSVSFFNNVGGGGALFMYDVHHCSPDRLQDPTILACAEFLSGLRVYDIRDPARPREIAYYSMGTISLTDPTVDDTISRPVIWGDRGLILFTSEFSGFHVARFEGAVWPFGGSVTCPSAPDYYFTQYNPGTACTAAAAPVTAAAPVPKGAVVGVPNTSSGASGPPAPALAALCVGALGLGYRRSRRRGGR